jgi:hypothetical protein
MPPELTDKPWAQIRYDYDHTDTPIDDICIEHGISPGTLRDRMRRWRWSRRRPPIPREGPPALPAPPNNTEAPADASAPVAVGGNAPGAPDDSDLVPRLQSASARVIPAIETILARLGSAPMLPQEMERAGRALSSLTRTLRELSGLLAQHQTAAGAAAGNDEVPTDIDEFRYALARRMDAFVEARLGKTEKSGESPPHPTGDR